MLMRLYLTTYWRWSARYRKQRFEFLRSLLCQIPTPFSILDVGGTVEFWTSQGFVPSEAMSIVLLNTYPMHDLPPHFTAVVGDGCDLSEYGDQQFEMVLSSSALAYVGNLEAQRRMASEIRRVGKRYFIQTPNRRFIVDWRTSFPCFQFLPQVVQAELACCWAIGRWRKCSSRQEALDKVMSIYDLSFSEFTMLFPGAKFRKERCFGLMKSFMAYEGFSA